MSEASEITAGAVPASGSSSARRFARAPFALIAAGLLLVAGSLLLIPPEATLGSNVRMVFFHGAVTWNGILMAGAAGVLGAFTLIALSRRPAPPAAFARNRAGWRFLTLATVFWVLSLSLSFPVMIRTWGGVLWNEPKLLMSAELVSLFLVAWAVSLFASRLWVTAALSLVAVGVMVALLGTTSGAFHPDNPVMGSGNTRFIGTFFTLLAGLVVASVGLAFLRRLPEE